MKLSPEREMAAIIKDRGLRSPVTQYRFCNGRKWAFDFAWPSLCLALECEGGTWIRGRHVRPMGFEKDCEKYNVAAILGWTVLRVTSKMIRDGRAEKYLCDAIERKRLPNDYTLGV